VPRSLLLLPVAVVAAVAWQADRRAGERRLVAEARAGYVADETDGRVVAEVRVRVWALGSGARERFELELEPSALGALVDPVPGFRGVQGANLQTAHDLERLVAERRLAVVTRAADARPAVHGAVGALRLERLPERRLDADGALDHAARTAPLPGRVDQRGAGRRARAARGRLRRAGRRGAHRRRARAGSA
jgi:hypothetical protein